MRLLAPWLVIVASLLATTARAQTAFQLPGICETYGLAPSGYYVDYTVDPWPKEARRIEGNERLVSRQYDELRLVLDGGKTIELRDCPGGDTGYAFLFERYDRVGRFYVVRRPAYEDNSYILVMTSSGQSYEVLGPPVWSPGKSRFLTIACSGLPPRGSLSVHVPSREVVATEAEFDLPCNGALGAMLSCSGRWDHEARISVACVPQGSRLDPPKREDFVLVRGENGTWSKSER
jgi:hypothetical protein